MYACVCVCMCIPNGIATCFPLFSILLIIVQDLAKSELL